MDEKALQEAKKMYEAVCAMLDARGWHYEKVEEKLMVRFDATGQDLPMTFIIRIDAERMLVVLTSLLPGPFPQALRDVGAIATSQINYKLADGSFDYDMRDGTVYFRLTSSYRSSLISQTALEYMFECTLFTVELYNDKLFMLSKGLIDLDKFLKSL